MSEKNPIDELFRSKLDGDGLKYSPEYWEQMETLVKKKNRRFLKTAVWISAVLLLIPAIYFTSVNLKDRSANKTEQTDILPTQKSSLEKQKLRGPASENTDQEQNSTPPKPAHPEALQSPATTHPQDKTGTIQTGDSDIPVSNSGNDLPANKPLQTTVPKAEEKESKQFDVVQEERFEVENDRTADVQAEISEPDKKQAADVQAEITRSESKPNEELPAEIIQADAETSEVKSDLEQKDLFSQNPEPQKQVFTSSPALAGLFLNPKPGGELAFPEIVEKKITENNTPLPKFKSRRGSPYIHLYAAAFFDYGLLEYRSDKSVADWKSSREKTQPYYKYGLDIRLQRKRFSVSSGLGITQWSEITNYSRQIDQYTFDTSFRLLSRNFTQRPDGTYAALVQKQIDTTSHTVTDTIDCPNCKIQFQYLSLPLALRYEIDRGSWSYFTEAGVTFSFLNKSQGTYSTSRTADGEGMQTERLEKRHFTPTLIQAGLALGVKYRLSRSLAVHARLRYHRALNSMMKDYKQQPDFYGIGFGFEWQLY